MSTNTKTKTKGRSRAAKQRWAAWMVSRRHAIGMTQSQMAEEVGAATYRTVLNWERGMSPSHAYLRPLAKVFGLEVEDLLREIG